MPEFDEIDLEILQLLVADARRPYSEIADHVGLSPPAVSDRVERLVDADVIKRFTLDVDSSKLVDGVRVLVEVKPEPDAIDAVRGGLHGLDEVEHVFVTAEGTVVAHAVVRGESVRATLADGIDLTAIRTLDVDLLSETDWTPEVSASGFGVECAECGSALTGASRSARYDGELRHFCTEDCRRRFEDRREQVGEEAT
jgi:DNA-binding Lrp family transcriptional regulator/YHS domain-containing protein